MRVLFTCGREPEYPRNAVLQAGLDRCSDLMSITERSPSLPLRYARLAARLLRVRGKYDLMVVGFFGQPLMLLARRLTSQPILFDAFISTYDTLCFDRGQFAPGSLVGRLAYWLDRTSCDRADLVLLDTQAHAEYFHRTFGVPRDKLRVLFVGCDESLFFPRAGGEETTTLVLHYGSFLPLHGADVIVRAAKILESVPHLRFRMIGNGPELGRTRRLAEELGLRNVEFRPPVPLARLPDEIAQATICLGGHFGPSEKASRVIAGKTFQCLAMGKPVIVGDNRANRELLTPEHDAWFCAMSDAEALAAAILRLASDRDLRTHLGDQGRQTFLARASSAVLGAELCRIVGELAAASREREPL